MISQGTDGGNRSRVIRTGQPARIDQVKDVSRGETTMERARPARRARWLMAFGWLALTAGSNVQAAPVAKPGTIYSKNKLFKLPIQVDDGIRSKIQELKLYVKGPDGKWTNPTSGTALQGSFNFSAEADGEYWFTFVTVDRSGKRIPENLDAVPPHRVVIVDTQIPSLKLDPVTAANGENFLRCTVMDANPDPSSVKLSYLSSTGVWVPMEAAFPETPGLFRAPAAISFRGMIRANVSDRAGNTMLREVDLSRQLAPSPAALTGNTPAAPSNTATVGSSPINNVGATESSTNNLRTQQGQPVQQPLIVPGLEEIEPVPGNAPLSIPNINPTQMPKAEPAPVNNTPFSGNNQTSTRQVAPRTNAGNPKPPAMPDVTAREVELAPANNREPSPLPLQFPDMEGPKLPSVDQDIRPTSGSNDKPKPESRPNPEKLIVPEPAAPALLPMDGMPPMSIITPPAETNQPKAVMINSLRCSLEYSVENVGSGMPARVEFWATLDKGKTWIRLVDEARGHSPAHLVMPGDGIYGILIRNAGVTQAPSLNDKPDCWVEVDTTRPFVNLLPASVGVGPDYGTLSILWTAYDKNFGSNPITLSYAAKQEGPWTNIVENHPNEGVYRWNLPQGIISQVYLRLEGKDKAGNISRIDTRSPVILEVPKPKAKVLRVSPGNSGN
jgi:hypothetical protein